MLAQELGRSGRRLDVEAQVVEALHERQRLQLVLVGDRDEDRPVVRHMHARGLQGLVEGTREFVVVADRLARRFHLGREVGVHTADLGEREGRGLDVPALLLPSVDLRDAQLAQRLAQDDLRGDVRHLHAG